MAWSHAQSKASMHLRMKPQTVIQTDKRIKSGREVVRQGKHERTASDWALFAFLHVCSALNDD